ncbi:MAG: hypothetical protein KDD44_09595, partial [Bdellovibrionales bacterium]|nr:hypothetical protein [Bdellovibrionales bacterium]
AEELNRVLDPQPRVTRAGVRYKANPLLIQNPERPQPAVESAVRGSNEAEAQAAIMNEPVDMLPIPSAAQPARAPQAARGRMARSDEPAPLASQEEPMLGDDELLALPDEEQAELSADEISPTEDAVPGAAASVSPRVESDVSIPEVGEEENLEISKAIEAAIKARLQKMQQPEAGQ